MGASLGMQKVTFEARPSIHFMIPVQAQHQKAESGTLSNLPLWKVD